MILYEIDTESIIIIVRRKRTRTRTRRKEEKKKRRNVEYSDDYYTATSGDLGGWV